MDAEAAVFELAAVAFDADGTGGGDFEGGFEDFAVAGAVGDAVAHEAACSPVVEVLEGLATPGIEDVESNDFHQSCDEISNDPEQNTDKPDVLHQLMVDNPQRLYRFSA